MSQLLLASELLVELESVLVFRVLRLERILLASNELLNVLIFLLLQFFRSLHLFSYNL